MATQGASGGRTAGQEASVGRTAGKQASGGRTAGKQAAGGRTAGKQASGGRGAEHGLAGDLVTVRGHDLHYVEVGAPAGPPVILLHSGLGSLAEWSELLPVLAAAGHRVVAYDRWGYGHSGERDDFEPPDFEDDTLDLAALLEALEMEQPVLIGLSDGGTIALMHAARSGDGVAGVLAAAAHAFLELSMVPGIEELRARFAARPELAARLAERHGPRNEAAVQAWLDGWLDRRAWLWDMRPELAAVNCPVLVVQGLDDEYAMPQHAEDIAAAIEESELALLPDVGHMVPQEAPEQLASLALEFARRVLGSDADAAGESADGATAGSGDLG